MFLFISGYGIFITYYNKKVKFKDMLKRILTFYFNYWAIFVVFIPIGIIIKVIKPTINNIIGNFIGVSDSFNKEWWFIKVYVVLILIYPLINFIVKKYKLKTVFIGTNLLFLISMLFNKLALIMENQIIATMFSICGLIFSQQIYFIIGVLVAKEQIFDRINKLFNKFKVNIKIISLVFIIISIEIYRYIEYIPIVKYFNYVIIMPIFIYSIVNIVNNNKMINCIGKNSNNIWLIHSFFCYYYFQKIVFIPRYSILIILWMIILSLISSLIINLILSMIKKIINIFNFRRV